MVRGRRDGVVDVETGGPVDRRYNGDCHVQDKQHGDDPGRDWRPARAATSTLAGLTSRWHNPASWAVSTASATPLSTPHTRPRSIGAVVADNYCQIEPSIQHALGVARVIARDDVRVIQAGGQARRPPETMTVFGIAG
jgi:hypothetical protein